METLVKGLEQSWPIASVLGVALALFMVEATKRGWVRVGANGNGNGNGKKDALNDALMKLYIAEHVNDCPHVEAVSQELRALNKKLDDNHKVTGERLESIWKELAHRNGMGRG